MSQIGRGRSVEDQVKQLGAEIRSLSNDLRRITEQREAAEAVNAAKQKQYEALMDEYKEITHKLQVTNDEFHQLEAEMASIEEEEESLNAAVSSVVRRCVESVRERRANEFAMQLAMLKLEATGAAKKGGPGQAESELPEIRSIAVEFGRYTCVMNLPRDATFEDIVAEACKYWGIRPDGVFMQGPDGAIYPQSAVVGTSIPVEFLEKARRERATGGRGSDDAGAGAWESKDEDGDELVTEAREMAPTREADTLVSVHGPDEAPPLGVVVFKLRRPRMAVQRMRLADMTAKRRRRQHREEAKEQARRQRLETKARMRAETDDDRRVELRYSAIVRELTIHSVFTVLFVLLLLTKRSVLDSYYLSTTVRSALVDREFVSEDEAAGASALLVPFAEADPQTLRFSVQSFRAVATPADFWHWVEGPLTNTIFPDPSNNKTGPILTYNRLVGPVRLRQLRVKPNFDCEVPKRAEGFADVCFPSYTEEARSSVPFGGNRGPAFKFTDGDDLSTPQYEGKLADYDPSGFVVELSGERAAWLEAVQDLQGSAAEGTDPWVDAQTRAVFVTFNLYNANLDLYLSSLLLFEQSLSGGLVTSFALKTARLNTCVLCSWFALLENLLHVFVLYMLLHIVVHARATIRFRGNLLAYFSDPWHLVDVALLLVYLTAGSVRLSLLATNSSLEGKLWSEPRYVDITREAEMYQLAFRLDSMVVFLCLLKMFKFLRLFRRMQQFIRVFVRASVEILFFAVLFLGTFLGFVILGHEIYGTEMAEFADMVRSVRTLLKMMVGDFDYERMRQVDGTWTPLFFFLFIAFVVLVLVNVFLAILNETYSAVREELTEEEERLRKLQSMRPSRIRTMEDTIDFLKKTFHPRNLFSTDLMRIAKEEAEEDVATDGAHFSGAGPGPTDRQQREAMKQARRAMGASNPLVV